MRIAERFPGYFRRKETREEQAAQSHAAERLRVAQERLHDFADGDNAAVDYKRRAAVFEAAAKAWGFAPRTFTLRNITTTLQRREWGRDDGRDDGGKAARMVDRRREAWDRRTDFLATLMPEDTPQVVYDGFVLSVAIDAAILGYVAVRGFRGIISYACPDMIRPHPSSVILWHRQTCDMPKMERASLTVSHFPALAEVASRLLVIYGDAVRAERHLAGERPAMVRYSHFMPLAPTDDGGGLALRVNNAFFAVGDVDAVGGGFERQTTVRRMLSAPVPTQEEKRGFDRYAA